MPNYPTIAITVGTSPGWEEGGVYFESYAEAVRQAGGMPRRLAPGAAGEPEATVEEIDGLLLSGGYDVDLRHFPRPMELGGEEPEAVMAARGMTLDPLRDRLEIPLARAAVAADLPLLGICRGCQLLNVALGGWLVLDLPTDRPAALRHTALGSANGDHRRESSQHAVAIEPRSRLARALGFAGEVEANSRHHQAVWDEGPEGLGRGLEIAARSPADGVIEAVELPAASWAVAVQWHPERAADAAVRERFRPLFDAFVAAARR